MCSCIFLSALLHSYVIAYILTTLGTPYTLTALGNAADTRLKRLQARRGGKGGEMTAQEKIRRRKIEAQVDEGEG